MGRRPQQCAADNGREKHCVKIEWDVPIAMDDGIVLRADVFRPEAEGRYPVILSYGPYGKGLAFQDGWKNAWDRLVVMHPNVLEGTSARYANFEVVDPEKWVPDGYAIVRVDARGAGRSPGFLDPKSVRETKDLYDCIEWAGTQPWSNGKVGLNGISYYATNQWYVLSTFALTVNDFGVWPIQHGMGERGRRSRATGELVSGPETLSPEELRKNRVDLAKSLLSHPLDDRYYRDRVPDWSKVKVPFLSAANWGGVGLHSRGNFEGFMNAASERKWLEVHGSTHWAHFYSTYGEALQKRFFGYFLKGEDNGWDRQPRVQLQVRHPGEKFVERQESEWPIARTQWTRFYPAPDGSFGPEEPAVSAALAYDPMGDGLTFLTPPLSEELEITGPIAAKLFVSSASRDADLFLVLRVFAPDGKEVVFQGSNDPRTPVALGWLRASHRKLDPVRSLPYRPYHPHDEIEPLTPGVPVELDIEIWPTCIVVPRGYRIGFSVRGNDYRYDAPPLKVPGLWYEMTGVGPFRHDSPADRPPEVFGATVTLHFEPGRQPYVLLPIIPPR
jgi:hypothetical protein